MTLAFDPLLPSAPAGAAPESAASPGSAAPEPAAFDLLLALFAGAAPAAPPSAAAQGAASPLPGQVPTGEESAQGLLEELAGRRSEAEAARPQGASPPALPPTAAAAPADPGARPTEAGLPLAAAERAAAPQLLRPAVPPPSGAGLAPADGVDPRTVVPPSPGLEAAAASGTQPDPAALAARAAERPALDGFVREERSAPTRVSSAIPGLLDRPGRVAEPPDAGRASGPVANEAAAREARLPSPPVPSRAGAEPAAATAIPAGELEAAERAAGPPAAGPGLEAAPPVRPASGALAGAGQAGDAAPAHAPQPALPGRVTWLAEQGGGTARLQLHPRELGEVEVSVRVRGNRVDVQFTAEDPAAQLAVAASRERLLDALGARELRMESFEVRSGGDAGVERDAGRSSADGGRRDDPGLGGEGRPGRENETSWRAAAPAPFATPPPTAPVSAAERGVDLRV